MKRTRAGIRSTRKKVTRINKTKLGKQFSESKTEEEETHTTITALLLVPNDETEADEPQTNNMFCYAALSDKQAGTLYTDATGALSTMSLDGMQYFFIAYDYDANLIFAIPISNVKDSTIVEAFNKVFMKLKEKGDKPAFNVTNNQAINPLKTYLKKKIADENLWN